MRRHSLMSRYAAFVEPSRFARVAGAPHLLAARLQPSYYNWPQAWLDLVFARDGEFVVIPFVQIDPPMISVRESSPLIWPSWLPLEPQAVALLEAVLEPWLRSHALVAGITQERLTYFTEDAALRRTFEAARAARFLGAAPSDDVFADVAPYVYAQRFAKGRRVVIRAGDAGLGASLLSNVAASVHADLGDAQRNELARAWYGLGIYGEVPSGSFDLSIGASSDAPVVIAFEPDPLPNGVEVNVAKPAFASVMTSFDVRDGMAVRAFSVRAREPILRPSRLAPAPVIGGSSGRILLVVRDDGLTAPDADVDQARALAGALNAQGFDARLTVASAARAADADLIHLFGMLHAHQFAVVLDEAERLGIPIVTTPLFGDFRNEALWGWASVRTMLTSVRDDTAQDIIEGGLERRLLLVSGFDREKPAWDEPAVRRMFERAGAAIFASAEEEAAARTTFGFAGPSRIVACVPDPPVAAEPVGALCGLDEYVLVHAGLDARGNQWLTMRAAAAVGAPCILLGSVQEVDYYYALLGAAGSSLIWLAEDDLTEGQIESLYGGARVFADFSWIGYGASRLVRAAAHGAMPAISTALPFASLWPEATAGADPASLASATASLRQAWMRAPAVGHQIAERTAQLADPMRSLQAVLGAYAEAAKLKSTAT